ncbi:hypothetical protein GCM10010428_62400 [Actinosynnema pretiosum subsp. pretiosum]
MTDFGLQVCRQVVLALRCARRVVLLPASDPGRQATALTLRRAAEMIRLRSSSPIPPHTP